MAVVSLRLSEKEIKEIDILAKLKELKELTSARPISDDEIIKYVLSLEKESLVFPSDLVTL